MEERKKKKMGENVRQKRRHFSNDILSGDIPFWGICASFAPNSSPFSIRENRTEADGGGSSQERN